MAQIFDIGTSFSEKEERNFNLYFERLRGQHTDITPPYSKINIETLTSIFTSVFLRKPQEMKSNAISVIARLQSEGQIFNNSHKTDQYYYCGVLWYWFNHLLVNGNITMMSKTMDIHILMASNIILEKKHNTIEQKLVFLSKESNAKELFNTTVTILNSKQYLFERRGFYSNPKTAKLIEELNDATN